MRTHCLAAVTLSALAACAISGAPRDGEWSVALDGSGSSPVVANGVLYVGAADGAVYAFESATGDARWSFQTGASLSTSNVEVLSPENTLADVVERAQTEGQRRIDMTPAVENGTVFVGSGDLSFYALDAVTGAKKWSYEAGPGMCSTNNIPSNRAPPVIADGTVYFVTKNGLHAVDAVSGAGKWLFETLPGIRLADKNSPEGLVLGDGMVYVTAWPFAGKPSPLHGGFVYAVDVKSGKARWVTELHGAEITAPVIAGGLVVAAVDTGIGVTEALVTLFGVDPADGSVRWKLPVESRMPRLLAAGGSIYLVTAKRVIAVDPATGRELWGFVAKAVSREVGIDERHVYAVTEEDTAFGTRHTLHALARAGGKEQWSQSVGGNIALAGDGVVYTEGARIEAFDAATGKPLWSRAMAPGDSVRLLSGGKLFVTSPTVTYFGTDRVDRGRLRALDAKSAH